MSETPRHSPEAEAEDQLDKLADKLGSMTLARIRLGLDEVSLPSPEEDTIRRPAETKRTRAKKPRARYTGGRADNEGSDSEHDPNWPQTSGGIKSSEQQEINARGRQFCRDSEAARLAAKSQVPATHIQPMLPGFSYQDRVNASWEEIEAEIERKTQGKE